jgi:hypothetical protein
MKSPTLLKLSIWIAGTWVVIWSAPLISAATSA